ncbi:MAG TPA: hypothetical protein VH277_14430 [Gemmatimonadaceae bacterium]|nr:hypothetical protein [Gemmatimonadaceae bacterium]
MTRNLFRRLMLCSVCITAACDESAQASRAPAASREIAEALALADVTTVPTHVRADLVENSAAVMSAQYPGVLYSVNDSGNDPVLFALDTLGADRGTWRVTGAANVDWEAASVGPCRDDARPRCIYIGDVGDNQGFHRSHVIYRVAEPEPRDSAYSGSLAPDSIVYSYPKIRPDVEAMYAAPNGDVFLITKRPIRMGGGRLRPALVFRLPAAAWHANAATIAELVDSLSIVPGSQPLRTITDASLASDGRHLAVRTYGELYIYATDSATGRVRHGIAPAICDVTSLGEPQGEGVSWVQSSGRFVFSSEGRGVPLHLATCPPPR